MQKEQKISAEKSFFKAQLINCYGNDFYNFFYIFVNLAQNPGIWYLDPG